MTWPKKPTKEHHRNQVGTWLTDEENEEWMEAVRSSGTTSYLLLREAIKEYAMNHSSGGRLAGGIDNLLNAGR
jgi:hypothetical protein